MMDSSSDSDSEKTGRKPRTSRRRKSAAKVKKRRSRGERNRIKISPKKITPVSDTKIANITQYRLTTRLGLFNRAKKSGTIGRGTLGVSLPVFDDQPSFAELDALKQDLNSKTDVRPIVSKPSPDIPSADIASHDMEALPETPKSPQVHIPSDDLSDNPDIEEIANDLLSTFSKCRLYPDRDLLKERKEELRKLLRLNSPLNPDVGLVTPMMMTPTQQMVPVIALQKQSGVSSDTVSRQLHSSQSDSALAGYSTTPSEPSAGRRTLAESYMPQRQLSQAEQQHAPAHQHMSTYQHAPPQQHCEDHLSTAPNRRPDLIHPLQRPLEAHQGAGDYTRTRRPRVLTKPATINSFGSGDFLGAPEFDKPELCQAGNQMWASEAETFPMSGCGDHNMNHSVSMMSPTVDRHYRQDLPHDLSYYLTDQNSLYELEFKALHDARALLTLNSSQDNNKENLDFSSAKRSNVLRDFMVEDREREPSQSQSSGDIFDDHHQQPIHRPNVLKKPVLDGSLYPPHAPKDFYGQSNFHNLYQRRPAREVEDMDILEAIDEDNRSRAAQLLAASQLSLLEPEQMNRSNHHNIDSPPWYAAMAILRPPKPCTSPSPKKFYPRKLY